MPTVRPFWHRSLLLGTALACVVGDPGRSGVALATAPESTVVLIAAGSDPAAKVVSAPHGSTSTEARGSRPASVPASGPRPWTGAALAACAVVFFSLIRRLLGRQSRRFTRDALTLGDPRDP